MVWHVMEVLLGPLLWALRAAPQPRSVPTSIPLCSQCPLAALARAPRSCEL